MAGRRPDLSVWSYRHGPIGLVLSVWPVGHPDLVDDRLPLALAVHEPDVELPAGHLHEERMVVGRELTHPLGDVVSGEDQRTVDDDVESAGPRVTGPGHGGRVCGR